MATWSRLKIFLAEDNHVNQLLAVRMLHKQGHTVVVAENGREVLSAILRDRFDLLLLDVQMPEIDGFTVTRAIRDLDRGRPEHLPIIALTAHAMSGDRERCLAAGMDGYIIKPINSDELFETIHALLSPALQ